MRFHIVVYFLQGVLLLFFHEILRSLRKDRGLTQRALADKIEVSPQAVSRWEKGEDIPSLSRYVALSKALGVSVTELLDAAPAEALGAPVKLSVEEMILAPMLARSALRNAARTWSFRLASDLSKITGPGVQIPRTAFRCLDAGRPPYCVEVAGDKLDSAGIADGDLAVVNPNEEPKQGALCLVSLYGMESLKYYYKLSADLICLRSDAGDVRLSSDDIAAGAFRIFGVIVSVLKHRPALRPF